MAELEVKRQPDGKVVARRSDGLPLTPVEREEARRRIKEEDPIITQDIMMEEFRRLQERILGSELKDFDYGWLKENQLDLYGAIKATEAEMDGTEGKPLSVLLNIIREWIGLVQEACRKQPEECQR